jgi:taurine dioxygenase
VTTATPQTFTFEPTTPVIGAVVRDLDLREELGERCQEELRLVLAERGVLFLPDQDIGPVEHLRFASVFGEPRQVSAFFPSLPDNDRIEVLEGHGESIGTDVWHTDLSWQERPAVATCLHAQHLPPVGGDTLWASMTAAYESLSPRLKEVVEDLEAEHTWEKSIVDYVRAGPDPEERYRAQRAAFPPVRHRVVQNHPVTGRRLLFVNDLFTSALHGLPRAESDALLALLTGLARVPEHQVRFRWQRRSVVIWDNRSVQHYAVTDYAPEYRKLHRVTLADPAAAFVALG